MDDKILRVPIETKEVKRILERQLNLFLEDGERAHIENFSFDIDTDVDGGIVKDELQIRLSRFRFVRDDQDDN